MKEIISGETIKGRGLGRVLGFPTINIPYFGDISGVFAGEVLLDGKLRKAAIHVGKKPTLDDEKKTVEAYLFDFNETVDPGTSIEVCLLKKIRKTKKLKGLEELKKQIAKDVVVIKNYFS